MSLVMEMSFTGARWGSDARKSLRVSGCLYQKRNLIKSVFINCLLQFNSPESAITILALVEPFCDP